MPTPADITIRPAVQEDADAVARLSDELRVHLGNSTGGLSPQVFLRDGFGPRREFDVLLACRKGHPIGYALFYDAYEPAYAARGVYLADLCVTASARGRGVGRALMDAVAMDAGRRGRSYVWWLSAPTNGGAQAFYDRLSADYSETTVSRAKLLRSDQIQSS
jgi:ribosomal protein S18 acetylase RimI-like enzyme